MSDINAKNEAGGKVRIHQYEKLWCWASSFLRPRDELASDFLEFGHWFDKNIGDDIRLLDDRSVKIFFDESGKVLNLHPSVDNARDQLSSFYRLWTFIASLGFRKLIIDARLQNKQIHDVLNMLRCLKSKLRAYKIIENKPIHYTCCDIYIKGDALVLRYVYFRLGFSKVIRWFESARTDFSSHRAIFYAAPKYAVIISLVAVGPPVAMALINQNYLLAALSLVELLIIMFMIYVLFSIIGSVEYDNEEKAYNLAKTFTRLTKYTERIKRNLQRAKNVQQMLLPNLENMPCRDTIDWAASFVPEEQVGGDYYDAEQSADGSVAIIFSDVSGHGMAAAFVTAIIKTTFQSWIDRGGSLIELVSTLNYNLCRLTPVESFAAVFFAVLNPENRELTYINAGHNPHPIIIRNGEIIKLDQSDNLLLGIQCFSEIEPACINMQNGDELLFISDGIIECMNEAGQTFGKETLTEMIKTNANENPNQLVGMIKNSISDFIGSNEQKDDMTMLCLKLKHC